ncbi:MAG: isopeptide-forming domain-containing fimbrial protein [Oscillospiraceae bacterium]|nr:isopeptide-forming domain-containing fimbrial protein [Oscillospiraceae bacterium]
MGITAAFASDYKITIDNSANTSVSIVGNTYTAYKLFDVTYTGSNASDPHAYSIDSNGDGAWAWSTLTSGLTADANGVYTNSTYGLTFTPTAADATVYSITSTMTDTQARALADALGATSVSKTGAVSASVTASAETAEIDVGQAGYWLVYGTAVPKDPTDDPPETVVAACALTTTDPTETVKPKVSIPKLDKKITGEHVLDDAGKAATAEVGSTVNFEIDSTVPDITGYTAYTFEINDTMSTGLSFTGTDTKDTINGLAITVGGTTLATDKYTVTHEVGSKSFKITIPLGTLQTLTKDAAIVVTYSAIVNDSALTTNYEKNTASLTYSNNPYDTDSKDTTPDKEVYVIDVNIDVDKYTGEKSDASYITADEYEALSEEQKDAYTEITEGEHNGKYMKAASNGTPLAGAQFKLYKGTSQPADDATAWYKWDDTNKKVTWVAKSDADTFTTTNEGKFNPQVKGLEAEKTGTAYGLLEIEAPAGYNLLKAPVPFTLTGAYDGTNNQATITASAGVVTGGTIDLSSTAAAQPVVTEPVLNQTGTELPSTGGIGTTIFYVVGSIMVVAAGVLLITKKRMSREG